MKIWNILNDDVQYGKEMDIVHPEMTHTLNRQGDIGKFLRDNDFDIEIWEAIDIMNLEM